MTRMILGAVAALAAAAALAGCGGSGSASGQGATVSGSAGASTAGTTTSGVAGAQTVQGSASFSANAKSLSRRIQNTVKAFANGNMGAASASGMSLVRNCRTTVDNKLRPHASTQSQRTAATDLGTACGDLQKALNQASKGNLSSARNLAQQAVHQARQASTQLR